MDGEQLLMRLGAAWSTWDVDATVGLMAEDAIYEDAAVGETYRGHDAIRTFLAGTFDYFSGFGVETHSTLLGPGGGYALEWTMSGSHTGDGLGLAPTGRSFAVRGASVGRVVGDLISRHTDYWNMANLLTQLGVGAGR